MQLNLGILFVYRAEKILWALEVTALVPASTLAL